ncbi:unnamed protein product [Dibothriocephalus latus]|uniref:Uncharacterized protein n=1 Tax=Dibothriocephalus latus TaxID=60516 RepID=A0A3P6QKW7_DIBLA|nr:unnamed protein product [Dibothriocephalus latus]
MDRFTCSANGRANYEHDADFDVEVPQMDFVEPRPVESTSSRLRAATSVARTKQFTEAVGDDANPAPRKFSPLLRLLCTPQ